MESQIEQRAEPRFNAHAAATIETIRGDVQTWLGCIAEVSGNGLRLMVREPVEPGQTIRITACGNRVLARVGSCVQAGSSYMVGVERMNECRRRVTAMREMFAHPGLTSTTCNEQPHWLPVVLPWLRHCWSFGAPGTK